MLYVLSLPPISSSLCVPPWACVYHRGRPANAVCLQGRQIVEVQLEPGEVYHAWCVSPSLSYARSPRPRQAKRILILIPGFPHLQVPHGDACPPHSLVHSRAAAQAHDRAHDLLVKNPKRSCAAPPTDRIDPSIFSSSNLHPPPSHRTVYYCLLGTQGLRTARPPPK